MSDDKHSLMGSLKRSLRFSWKGITSSLLMLEALILVYISPDKAQKKIESAKIELVGAMDVILNEDVDIIGAFEGFILRIHLSVFALTRSLVEDVAALRDRGNSMPDEQTHKSSAQPPSTAEKLILLLAPKKVREVLPGDLEEEFHEIASKHGFQFARRWYWTQALLSSGPMIRHHVLNWIGLGRRIS